MLHEAANTGYLAPKTMLSNTDTAPHAVLFDLDGTLIDSLVDIADATNRMLAQRGLPRQPYARFPQFIGEGASKLVERALAAAGAEMTDVELDAGLESFRQEYARALVVHTRPYPGVLAMLEALQAAGVRLAVLSNKPDPWVHEIVPRLLPGIDFVAVQGQKPDVPRKPDPAAALALCSRLGAEPAEAVFVGDSAVDMMTAQAAGMRPVAVGWGFATRAELLAAQPEQLHDTAEALMAWLLNAAW